MELHTPIFIIGNPRSGTSLLRLLLTHHPQIVIPPECGFLVWLYPRFCNEDFNDSDAILRFTLEVIECKKFETWGINAVELRGFIQQYHPQIYAEAAALVYFAYAKKHRKAVAMWGDKNNYYLNHIQELHTIYPKARFIHLIRDGRDVAASYKTLQHIDHHSRYAPDLPSDITPIAQSWKSNIHKIQQALLSIDGTQKLEIRYEDLVTEPKVVLHDVCTFLNISFASEMLEYHTNPLFQEPEEFSTWKERNTLAIDTTKCGYYKDILPPEDIHMFEDIAGHQLKTYGYLPD